MRKLYFGLIVAFFSGFQAVSAQTLSISPIPSSANETVGVLETVAPATLKNLTNQDRFYQWTRTIIKLDPSASCFNYVSANGVEYSVSDNYEAFQMGPNAVWPVDIHLQNYALNASCCAIIHLKIDDLTTPGNSVTGIYIFNNCSVSGVKEKILTEASIFPNPTSDFFKLEHVPGVKSIEVYGIGSGNLCKIFEVNSEQLYPVDDFENGTYVLVLKKENGAIVGAIELRKE